MKPRNDLILNGIVINHLTFTEAVEQIVALARQEQSQLIVTPNADHIVRLADDAAFREVYAKAALRVADGMPLIWASRWLKNPLPERVTGADLLPALCEQAAKNGLSVYLLGAPPGVAQQAAEALQKRYASLSVAGTYSPPLGFEQNQEEIEKIIQQINAVKPHILFVGLGSPKQEFWMAKYQSQLHVGVLLGIGAAIAFAAGTEKRAPRWMQRVGLEWLFRWGQDPKRLTKRYWGDLRFFYLVWREKRRG
jgi:N-acetylglucosaminyldiphosphoundecaprenol N-acetyl-beta-D-mannosaminyltransferase